MATALEGLRILDLTSPEGHLCGRLLADLGAEVIKVEPTQGDPTRHTGPFKGDAPDPDSSLSFAVLNTNKKGITLDLARPEGRDAFKRLARTADAVIETFPPGRLEAWDLDYQVLREDNPGLVMASITGFGLSGPYSGFKAPSIVVSAMGGVMYLCGSPEDAPLAPPCDLPYHLASSLAAYGVLLALRHRESTGHGQRVEVSCQEVQAEQQHVIVNYSANATFLERAGSRSPLGGGMPYGVYPARDGHCHLVVISQAHWRNFLEWMGNPEALSDPAWENRHLRNTSADFIEPLVMELTRGLSKADLFTQGQAHHVTVAPINRPDEFTLDPHVTDRETFTEVNHPTIGNCRLPEPPFRMSQTPGRIVRPSPRLGEHNDEVLGRSDPRPKDGSPPAPHSPSTGRSRPLEGIRILDFSQAIAGPVLTRVLAQDGAEVIKVESSARQQRGRASPGLDPRIALQQAVTFADRNMNKRSITVNMNTEEGRHVIRRLIPLCDVVVENFSPRVIEGWGLDYREITGLREDAIMVRLPAFGLTGPYRDYVGLAAVAMGVTGMYHLWSYPDSPEPAGPPVWVPDYLSAAFASVALLSALRHRDRTGKGQLIELSQMDATAYVLGTVYLDYFVNGHMASPLGNGHRYLAPHGVYRCSGHDAWCAIAIGNEEEWRALCRALGSPQWAQDEKYATMEQRLVHRQELDGHIEEWTRDRTTHRVMHLLQEAGVPAGAVLDGEGLFRDPHLRQRGFIVPVEDPDVGTIEYPGTSVHLSETPGVVERCHKLGEDNEYVFGTLLEMSPEEISSLEESGVLA